MVVSSKIIYCSLTGTDGWCVRQTAVPWFEVWPRLHVHPNALGFDVSHNYFLFVDYFCYP